jgi:hypothetical protein
MQKRILQTGILSIFVLVLFVACPRITCGCSPAPLAFLTLSSTSESVAQGSSTKISVEISDIYDESAWPLQIVVKPAQEPQTGSLPLGVSVDSLVLTKDSPKGLLTVTVSKSAAPGPYNFVVYPTSALNRFSYRENFTLMVTTQP